MSNIGNYSSSNTDFFTNINTEYNNNSAGLEEFNGRLFLRP